MVGGEGRFYAEAVLISEMWGAFVHCWCSVGTLSGPLHGSKRVVAVDVEGVGGRSGHLAAAMMYLYIAARGGSSSCQSRFLGRGRADSEMGDCQRER